MSETFRKEERIVSQKLIDELFTGGQSHSLAAFPLRAVYMLHAPLTSHPSPLTSHPSPLTSQILISVPKKRLRHAVDRNRVKRQLREAYRHHRQLLDGKVPEGQQLAIAFIWQSDRIITSAEVAKRMSHLLERIAKNL